MRLWRKGTIVHLVGMQTGTATVGNSMEFPQKTITGTGSKFLLIWQLIPLQGLYPKNPETPIQKNLCTLIFIAA